MVIFLLQRNPSIKFYGLPWTFPGWVGSGVFDPFHNRTKILKYITNWIEGAKTHHDLDISYIGVSELLCMQWITSAHCAHFDNITMQLCTYLFQETIANPC